MFGDLSFIIPKIQNVWYNTNCIKLFSDTNQMILGHSNIGITMHLCSSKNIEKGEDPYKSRDFG